MTHNWIWEPSRQFIASTNVWKFMHSLGFKDPNVFLAWSRENIQEFWDALVRTIGVEWFAPYSRVLDTSAGPEWAKWFIEGELNIAHNCLDRHASSGRTAILWEAENGATKAVSFAELAAEVNRLANGMRAAGLAEGDRIAMVMPMVPEIVTILYASFKVGVVAVPIFSGFGESAIATRLENSGARFVFTAETLERRGKRLPLADTVRAAASRVPTVESILTNIDELASGQPDECETKPLSADAPCLILYTSGTTGKPKGCVHTHSGALVQTAKEIWLGFDHKPEDRFFWLSDIGWMMGAWTIIGNHHFGGTILIYDGAPDWPESDRLWQILERHRITTFGVSPTAI